MTLKGSIFFIQSSQAKNGNVYLRIKKKRDRIVGKKQIDDFKMCVLNCIRATCNFYCNRDFSLKEKYFIDFRPIKINSGHHFHFICLCKDKYCDAELSGLFS